MEWMLIHVDVFSLRGEKVYRVVKKKKLLKQNDWHGGVIGNIRIFFCLSALWIDDFFVSSYCVRR